jgi:hypothetical protein
VLARHHDVVVRTVRRCRKRPFGRQLRNVGFEVRVSSYRLPFLFSSILLMKFFSKFTESRCLLVALCLWWLGRGRGGSSQSDGVSGGVAISVYCDTAVEEGSSHPTGESR